MNLVLISMKPFKMTLRKFFSALLFAICLLSTSVPHCEITQPPTNFILFLQTNIDFAYLTKPEYFGWDRNECYISLQGCKHLTNKITLGTVAIARQVQIFKGKVHMCGLGLLHFQVLASKTKLQTGQCGRDMGVSSSAKDLVHSKLSTPVFSFRAN